MKSIRPALGIELVTSLNLQTPLNPKAIHFSKNVIFALLHKVVKFTKQF